MARYSCTERATCSRKQGALHRRWIVRVLAVLLVALAATGCRPVEQQAGRSTTVARAAKATQTAEGQPPADAKVTCTAQQALDDALAQLEQERAAWDAHEPRHYRFQTEVGSESDPYLSVQTMEVKDGMRIALSREQPESRGPGTRLLRQRYVGRPLRLRASGVCPAYRRECACDCTWEWKITYDPKYHYVVSFHLVTGRGRTRMGIQRDAVHGLGVTGLACVHHAAGIAGTEVSSPRSLLPSEGRHK